MSAPAGILNQPHGLRWSGVAAAAIYVLIALGVLFGLLAFGAATVSVFKSQHTSVLSLTDPDSLLADVVGALAGLVLTVAQAGALVGLARHREYGRLLATYVAGFWAATGVFLPLALGFLFVLYHQHLPAKPAHGLRGIMAALADRSTSPAGLGRWVVGLLALTTLLFAAGNGWSLLINGDGVSFSLIVAAYTVLEVLAMGVAVVGVGRRLDWGLPAAVFACGLAVITAWAFPFGLAALLVLLNHARGEVAAV